MEIWAPTALPYEIAVATAHLILPNIFLGSSSKPWRMCKVWGKGGNWCCLQRPGPELLRYGKSPAGSEAMAWPPRGFFASSCSCQPRLLPKEELFVLFVTWKRSQVFLLDLPTAYSPWFPPNFYQRIRTISLIHISLWDRNSKPCRVPYII